MLRKPNEFETRRLKPEQKLAAHTLDRHLTVTAGPGAGKTFVLVERYLEILRAKKVSVENIVAITFTNRAANEMRQRVRERIDGLLRTASGQERSVWLRHKRTLEGAVITTIHGFCARLLREFPVEADIDPQFTLLDEHQAAMLLESVVEQSLADAIHHGDKRVLQFARGTGRAALATALVELHRQYRGEGLSLELIEKITAVNHSSRSDYDAQLKELDALVTALLSARLTKAADEKRAKAAAEWPVLRRILSEPPTEKTIAAYCQATEDFWELRPQRRSHPTIEKLDELLWGGESSTGDRLGGSLPAVGFDLLAREYSLAALKLLRAVEQRLDAEKQRLSVLDFDDLQLRALRLLQKPEVLARVADRYKFFLVDEFQDTNGLQRDLMTKLALAPGMNLFIVGDRKQSIYGFRGADVDVFTEMSAAIERAGGAKVPLRLNFRSQKPLLDALNFLFARIFQPREETPTALGQLGYVEHESSLAERAAENEPPLVEVIIGTVNSRDDSPDDSDRGSRTDELTAHECDAEQVASRIQSLVDPHNQDALTFKYGDIAILLRAFTGVWTYENALRRADIPYLTVQGKGFYQREEITDLIQLLRFLDNTTDELALAAVLRSPLGGISDNGLFALRCAPWINESEAPVRLYRRNLLQAVRRHREIEFIDETEHEALDRFDNWLAALIERRNRYSLAQILRHAVASSEFMTVIAANFDGAQRVANVDKLFRLAEQFEKSGQVIRDFVRYVEEFEAIGGREGEGQIDETANVVRLMTIHQAKGLEYPVIIIPDLHREPNRREGIFVLDRYKGLTVRVPDGRSRSVRGALFNELQRRNRWREVFESMRLLYVAATRAEDRLILSGAVEKKSLANLSKSESDKWLAWIWRALDLEEHAQSGVLTVADGAQFKLTMNRDASRVEYGTSPENEIRVASPIDPSRPLEQLFPLLQPMAREESGTLRRFSVTQLLNFQRCARQYYFDRMLRTPSAEEREVWNDAEAPEPPANLTATLKGAVIHRFCETFCEGDEVEARLRTSIEEVVARRQPELAGRVFDIDHVAAARALLPLAKNYLASDVFKRVSNAARIAAANSPSAIPSPQSSPGLWSELRFRMRRPLGVLSGTIDKLLITPSATGDGVDVEIIDFKTNRFSLPAGKTESRVKRAVATVRTATMKTDAEASAQGVFDFDAVAEAFVAENIKTLDLEVTEAPESSETQIEIAARDYQLQMQSYALALRLLLGYRTVSDRVRTRSASDTIVDLSWPQPLRINSLRATLHFIDPNVEIALPASLLDHSTSAAAIDQAMNEIALLDSELDAESFPPLPASHCRMCNFRDLCPVGREWLRQEGSR